MRGACSRAGKWEPAATNTIGPPAWRLDNPARETSFTYPPGNKALKIEGGVSLANNHGEAMLCKTDQAAR